MFQVSLEDMRLVKCVVVVITAIAVVLIIGILFCSQVNAQASSPDSQDSCPIDSVSEDCNPPVFRDIEVILVRLLYAIWGLAGLIFMYLMIRIGITYMGAQGNIEKITEAKNMAGKWLIGIMLLFFSRSFISTIMTDLIDDTSSCYQDLKDPGFTFFFSDVCTVGDAPAISCSDIMPNTGVTADAICGSECLKAPYSGVDPQEIDVVTLYTVTCNCKSNTCRSVKEN